MAPTTTHGTLLKVLDLQKIFAAGSAGLFRRAAQNGVRAVDGVSFELAAGETLGLVGESGSGKSTVARMLLGLEEPTAGTAFFEDTNIFTLSPKAQRKFRRQMQFVFQDPYTSLNPKMKVGELITEPWRVHRGTVDRSEWKARATELLERVGLDRHAVTRFPHEFSGGQRQRIAIARALALRPRLLVCDEPVSALDASVQSQVLNLLVDLQADHGLAYLFIAHDLAVIRHISHRVAVMYLGRIVEIGDAEDVYTKATHPYTHALLSAVPDIGGKANRERIVLRGDLPSAANPPSGCRFRTRCWKAQPLCAEEDPPLIDRIGIGHPSACHFPELPR